MIRPLTPADQPAAESFLLRHLATSMFLVNNLRASGIVDGGAAYQGAYVAEFSDAGEIIGMAAHYWNGNLMVQSTTNAGVLARAALTHSGRPLRGIVGDGGQCASVIASLSLDVTTFQMNEAEGLFHVPSAQLVIPPLAAHVRRAEARDRETLVQFDTEYELEALGETDPTHARSAAERSTNQRLREARLFVLEIDGLIVASSAFNARVDHVAQIGGVWTPPALRGRGYARACVAGALVLARDEGVTEAILFTGDNNAPARKAYAAIGFNAIGTFYIGIIGRDVWVKSSFAV